MKKIFTYFRLRKIRISITVIVLLLAACTVGTSLLNEQKDPKPGQQEQKQTEQKQSDPKQVPVTEQDKPPRYWSDTAPEDCLLCNGGKETLLTWYFGQENIGIISLNTFKLSCVEINRYDDNKKLIEEPVKGSSSHIFGTGDNGFLSMVSEAPNRGYAHAYITFNNDEFLDVKKAGKFLCTDCLNRIMDKSWSDKPYGIGVIDFMTKDIRLLEPNITAFIFNNYYVSCDLREKREEDSCTEMDMLIFYCPERYEK